MCGLGWRRARAGRDQPALETSPCFLLSFGQKFSLHSLTPTITRHILYPRARLMYGKTGTPKIYRNTLMRTFSATPKLNHFPWVCSVIINDVIFF